MKKNIFAVLCIIIAALFSGCNAAEPIISYDYKFGYASTEADGLLETLSYKVSAAPYENSDSIKPPFAITGTGEYTVSIYKESDEQFKYKIVTELRFNGKYCFTAEDKESSEFEDIITSTSYALINSENITALQTNKTFETSVPVVENGIYSAKKAYYTVDITYSGNSISSEVKDDENYPDAFKMGKEANKNFSAVIKERFVDNEFIFLAIRLQPLTTSFKDSFKVPDPLNGIVQSLSFQAAEKTESKKFKDTNYDCVAVSAYISGKYSGRNTLMYFTNDYSMKYLTGDQQINRNISLMVEFKQENLIYTLDEYQNFAQTAL